MQSQGIVKVVNRSEQSNHMQVGESHYVYDEQVIEVFNKTGEYLPKYNLRELLKSEVEVKWVAFQYHDRERNQFRKAKSIRAIRIVKENIKTWEEAGS